MLSALSVLALLLAAGAPPASSKKTPAEVIALAVDVDFTCSTPPTTQSLILPPKAEGQLEVPKDCPDIGADWRLLLTCASPERCAGEIRTAQTTLARIQGPRQQLTVKPVAPKPLPTLERMRLRVTGQYPLQLDAAAEHQPPVQLLLVLPAVTGIYTLAPSEPAAQVDFEHQGRRVSLKAQVSRTDARHVHLQLWTLQGAPLLDEKLEMEAPRELDCHKLEDICAGTVRIKVREYQRVL